MAATTNNYTRLAVSFAPSKIRDNFINLGKNGKRNLWQLTNLTALGSEGAAAGYNASPTASQPKATAQTV